MVLAGGARGVGVLVCLGEGVGHRRGPALPVGVGGVHRLRQLAERSGLRLERWYPTMGATLGELFRLVMENGSVLVSATVGVLDPR